MSRPSFQRRIPPIAIARLGGSLIPSTNIIPLTRWTSRSPATPVPYAFQHRQRANLLGSKAILGLTFPCHVSQSRFCGERSNGGGYSHAPVGSFLPSQPSTIIRSPRAPCATISFAFAQRTELTRCEPICTIRLFFCAAVYISTPSAAVCDIGFSQ